MENVRYETLTVSKILKETEKAMQVNALICVDSLSKDVYVKVWLPKSAVRGAFRDHKGQLIFVVKNWVSSMKARTENIELYTNSFIYTEDDFNNEIPSGWELVHDGLKNGFTA